MSEQLNSQDEPLINLIIKKTNIIKDIAKLIYNYTLFSGFTSITLKNTNNIQDPFTKKIAVCTVSSLVELSNGDIACNFFNKIKIWRNNVCIYELSEDDYNITCLYALTNNILVSGDVLGCIRYWYKNLCLKKINTTDNCAIFNMCELANSDLVTSTKYIIRIWRDLICIGQIRKFWHDHTYTDIISLSNNDIISYVHSNSIRIWRNYEVIHELISHTQPISCLLKISDTDFASGSVDNTIKIWHNNICVNTLNGHTAVITCLAVLNNGDLASGSEDKTIKIWRNNMCIKTLIGHTKCINRLVSLPNNILLSGSKDGTIKIWL